MLVAVAKLRNPYFIGVSESFQTLSKPSLKSICDVASVFPFPYFLNHQSLNVAIHLTKIEPHIAPIS